MLVPELIKIIFGYYGPNHARHIDCDDNSPALKSLTPTKIKYAPWISLDPELASFKSVQFQQAMPVSLIET